MGFFSLKISQDSSSLELVYDCCRPASCPSNRQKVSRALHSNLNIFKIDQNSVRLLKVFPYIVEITKILNGLESLPFKISLEYLESQSYSLSVWLDIIYLSDQMIFTNRDEANGIYYANKGLFAVDEEVQREAVKDFYEQRARVKILESGYKGQFSSFFLY